jgi:hypothetical protein
LETEIVKIFLTQGPFAVLFVWLLFTTKKESNQREMKLYQTIDEQTRILDKFSDKYDLVIEKLDELKEKIN